MDHPGSRSDAVRAHYGLALLALLLPVLGLILGGWLAWNATLRDAQDALRRAAVASADRAAKVLDRQWLIASGVNDLLRGMDADAVAAHAVALRDDIRATLRRFPQVAGVTVTDGAGHVLLSTSEYPIDGSAAASLLRAVQDPHVPWSIGGVIVDRLTGQSGVAIGTPWGGDAERPSGLVLTTESTGDFAAEERLLVGGRDASAILVRADGTELAKYPASQDAVATAWSPALPPSIPANPAGGTVWLHSAANGQDWLVGYAKLPHYPVYAGVGWSRSAIVAQWRDSIGMLLMFGIPATIALVALSMLLARRSQQARSTDAALQEQRRQRATAEEALRQAQKLEDVGRLTGGIAHDFNNHLTVISSNIELLKRRMPPEARPLLPLMDAAMQGVQRAAGLTHRLLAFARQQPAEPEPLDMARLVNGMADLLHTALGETVTVEIGTANGLWQARVDANQMESAILHLAVNARDAMAVGGRLTIDVANVQLDATAAAGHGDVAAGDYVMVSVADTGAGMSPDVAARACEPFFTTKPPGKGIGLGLTTVNALLRQSDGHMTIASEKGHGTTVTLYLPRHLSESDTSIVRAPKAAAAASGVAGETVLVVEDDDAVRRSSAQALHEIGYQVLEAPDAMEAIRLIADRGGIDLLFTDVGLPGGVDGRALADAARTACPAIRILFTTGYARYAPRDACSGGSFGYFLAKPFTLEELGVKVREVLDAGGAEEVAPVASVSV
ncbi:MAG TPA: ATP-binding protein [Acetobacteraceae bacterium]|jgi:signal transduction histidine kinase/ActR/RegA family two-component response regulator